MKPQFLKNVRMTFPDIGISDPPIFDPGKFSMSFKPSEIDRGSIRAWMKEIERRFVMRAGEDGGMREVGGWIVAALENNEIAIDGCYMALGE